MDFSFVSVPNLLIPGFVLNYLISIFGFNSILSFKLNILFKVCQINYIYVYLCQIKMCRTKKYKFISGKNNYNIFIDNVSDLILVRKKINS